jgi:apolipoprotein N-acyltransferase
MDSKPNNAFLAAPALAITAALFFLGTGLAPVWAFTWLAAIPVLWISSRLSASQAFFVAVAAYALGGLNEWSYSRTVIPTGIVVSILLFLSCMFAASVLLFRYAMTRGKLWQAVLIFPAFWVTMEFVVAMLSIHGTFGNIGYSQMDFLPIVQIASVTGIWGISFCVFLFASTVAALLSAPPSSTKIPLGASVAIFLVGVFGFGIWRLAATPKNSPSIKVALIGSSANGNFFAQTPEQLNALVGRYAEQAKPLASQGIHLLILPEHTGPITDESQAETDALLGKIARDSGAFVAIGVDRISPDVSWNQERLYSPSGSLVAIYNKHHLLPPWENQFRPDTKRTVLKEASGKWGMEICKDMDFPRLSRQYAQDGIGMLIVSASDFVNDGWLHGRMAVLRGVESGFSIARSVDLGILTATDDRGRVLAEKNTTSIGAPLATLVADVPVRHDATIYSRFGNWFGWFSIVLLVISVASMVRSSPPSTQNPNS